MWNSDYSDRWLFEKGILKQNMPQAVLYDRDGYAYVEYWVGTTKLGERFKLKVEIPDAFPYACPDLYVISPLTLRMHDGPDSVNSLGASHAFHTHGNGPGGCVSICHTESWSWDPATSLYQVLKKGALWCECYSVYLETGETIDALLPKLLRSR